MIRAILITAAASLLLGAARPPAVGYRLGVESVAARPPLLTVEMRLRGDADGETAIALPAGLAGPPAVSGARVEAADGDRRLLRHRPGAKLAIRYRLYAPADPGGLAALGEGVFAIPEGRAAEAASFRWSRLPKGWRAVSDIEPDGLAHPLTVDDVARSVLLAGPELELAGQVGGGVVRAAALGGDAARARRLAEAAAPVVAALRAYWGEEGGPFLVASGPFAAPVERGDGVALPPVPDSELRDVVASAVVRAWIPRRTGRLTAPAAWFTDGFAEFLADRALLRAGLLTPDAAVGRLAAADRADRRGVILALKWGEDIRRKTAGRADLDDVILRMRDHYRRFPPGQGPDVVTGLVSAAWVAAGLDLRPDIARYAAGGAAVPLSETLFDGCLNARVTVSPGFDAGFDTAASFAAGALKGVRRRGPAWNSGLREGMALLSWTYAAGDTSREILLTVRDARKRAKTIRYWPYGDADMQTRRLQLASVSGEALAACGRRIGGA